MAFFGWKSNIVGPREMFRSKNRKNKGYIVEKIKNFANAIHLDSCTFFLLCYILGQVIAKKLKFSKIKICLKFSIFQGFLANFY